MTVDKSASRVRSMFAQIARRYDFLNHLLSAGNDIYWRWQTARTIAPGVDGPILDVCTGTGDLAIAINKRVNGHQKIVGTDFTHEMLVLAGKKVDRIQDANIALLEADAESLPFATDSFAAVSVAFGLRNVADTRRGLEEMIRVCAPNGQILVLEFSQPNVPLLGGVYRWYFRNVLPRLGQWLARNRESAYEYLPESVSEFPSGAALLALMESCGLSETTAKPMTLGVATLYRGRKPGTLSPDQSHQTAKLTDAIP